MLTCQYLTVADCLAVFEAIRPRIQALRETGCDAFTIGSAAFDGSFSPRKGLLQSQLTDILAAL